MPPVSAPGGVCPVERTMSRASMTMLTAVTETFAEIDGPIPSRVASGVLLALSGMLQDHRDPITLRTLEAIMGVVVALRDDFGG